MDLFEEIVRETFLITESVSTNSINDAIRGMHPVWITYNDEKGGGGKNRRLIYPIAYGKTSAGNPVIRAFQPQGSSKRGLTTPPNDREYPKWKYFRQDRIKNWRVINSKTYDIQDMEGYEDGIINTNGDNSMSIVYTIAPIGGAKNLPQQNPEIGYKPITKQDVENIPTEEEPEEEPTTTTATATTQQPKKYTVRQVVNNILNRIKNFGQKVTQPFKKNTETLDNSKTNDNITVNNNNLTAPDTEPVTKQDIEQTTPVTQQTKPTPKPGEKPITKQDVNGEEEETTSENKIVESYRDMMSRWNNLEK